MRRHRAPFRALDTFFAVRSWVDCTTNMSGFDLRQAQVKRTPMEVEMFGIEQSNGEHPERRVSVANDQLGHGEGLSRSMLAARDNEVAKQTL
jgi:hypothetical protein